MTDPTTQQRLWNLHVGLAMDLATALAQPLYRDDLDHPTWQGDIRDILNATLTGLDLDLGHFDAGLAAALDGLHRLLTDLRDQDARDWTPADTLALLAAAETCANHTARVGNFIDLWPHPKNPDR
ncbi:MULTISPECIES: hypothetical protein [unclassified Crossiella]|uniref:hypothetical protein n=1 Tax=unclassified Crossiella TaxID=2620835 RepID=UPI001FFEEC90|nr:MULTISPECIES: hypothetical protein [unclassified Crossiella]MCK2245409.1 hypothetical protein [Crossiella sp. S99.2]MCK2259061.1 hypothetical protein [Crossiella sp. S99.1]